MGLSDRDYYREKIVELESRTDKRLISENYGYSEGTTFMEDLRHMGKSAFSKFGLAVLLFSLILGMALG